jgi:uncharacterized protein YqeY
MSQLKERIEADLRIAMKNKEGIRLSALRMLKSDLQYEMTKTGVKTLSDEDVLAAIKKAVKKRKDSIEQYTSAGRPELAAPEAEELAILEQYLPAEATEAEIQEVIEIVVSQMKPEGPSAMGKVMGAVMAKLKEKNADGALVKQLVQKRLGL